MPGSCGLWMQRLRGHRGSFASRGSERSAGRARRPSLSPSSLLLRPPVFYATFLDSTLLLVDLILGSSMHSGASAEERAREESLFSSP